MNTDALIEALANDAASVKQRPIGLYLTLAGGIGLFLATCAVAWLYGIRADLSNALIAVSAKIAFCAMSVAVAVPLLLRLSRPNTNVSSSMAPAIMLVIMSLSAAAYALALIPASERLHAWTYGSVPACLQRIPLLAVPVAILLLVAVRKMAPTRLTLAGAALGAVAGGISGIAYSLFCPIDSVAYIATWYLASILACAGIGGLVGRWLLRW